MSNYVRTAFVIVCLVFVTACQSNMNGAGETNQGRDTQQSVEGEMNVKSESYKQYTQSLEKGIARDGYKEELFSSDEQREIEQYISQMEKVDFVYAEVFDEQLNVSVSVKEGPYEEIEDEIYVYLHEQFPGRKVEVFIIQTTG